MPEWTIRMCVLTGLAGMGLGPEAALGDDHLLLPTSQARSVSFGRAGGDCETGESWASSDSESAEGFDPFDATVGEGGTIASQQSSISGTVMSATGVAEAGAEVPLSYWESANAMSSFSVTFTVERTVIVTIDAEVQVCCDCATAQVHLSGTPFSLFVQCDTENESDTAEFFLGPGEYTLFAKGRASASDQCASKGGYSYASYTVELTAEDPCPVDLDGSGSVDFGDILAILTAWGSCSFEETCSEDLDDSGTVDFGDILVVLGAWGPCAYANPLGACCFPDGTCVGGVDADVCAIIGGVHQGNGTTCAETCLGACCFSDGTCLDATVEGDCQTLGGSYQGGESNCEEACVVGACCLDDDACLEGTFTSDCVRAGGTFQGHGSTCAEGCIVAPCGVLLEAPFNWTGNSCDGGTDCDRRSSRDVRFRVVIPEAGDWKFTSCGTSQTALYVDTKECCGDEFQTEGFCEGITVPNLAAGDVVYATVEAIDGCGQFAFRVRAQ